MSYRRKKGEVRYELKTQKSPTWTNGCVKRLGFQNLAALVAKATIFPPPRDQSDPFHLKFYCLKMWSLFVIQEFFFHPGCLAITAGKNEKNLGPKMVF